ncbi:MAG: molybdenum ABC transporter ATP-binding protein, partial [Bacteroidota bacterium]
PLGITGIFGPSGAGKTSLLHAIAGLVSPQKGKISLGDKVLFDREQKINLAVEKRNIGYVFQEGRLFPHMSVEKNLLYGFKKGVEPKVSFEEVVQLLGLTALLNSKPSQISGGERQRTALGRSLLSSPDILLLDEPFSAVDMNLRQQILPFIIRIQERVGVPILVVSHDLPDLLKLSEQLFLMKEGKCIGHGAYHELLKKPELREVFGNSSLVNAIEMEVVEVDIKRGLNLLRWKNEEQEVWIKSEQATASYRRGQKIKIFIHANDIALSHEKLPQLSIQNQIKGRVKDLIQRDATWLCIIDAGFKLVVEITAESQKRMDIQTGNEIWCLFKSVAIDVAG